MPMTVVRCSMPDCLGEATSKIAAPWRGGHFSEPKTYAYACPDHAERAMDYAERRPKPAHLSPGESVGDLAAYPIEPT